MVLNAMPPLAQPLDGFLCHPRNAAEFRAIISPQFRCEFRRLPLRLSRVTAYRSRWPCSALSPPSRRTSLHSALPSSHMDPGMEIPSISSRLYHRATSLRHPVFLPAQAPHTARDPGLVGRWRRVQ